jgi:hypothetical protein
LATSKDYHFGLPDNALGSGKPKENGAVQSAPQVSIALKFNGSEGSPALPVLGYCSRLNKLVSFHCGKSKLVRRTRGFERAAAFKAKYLDSGIVSDAHKA